MSRKLVRSAGGLKSYAKVRYRGKDKLLGRWGSAEAKVNYKRFIAEIAATNQCAEAGATTVTDVAVAYMKFAKTYYRKRGRLEPINLRPWVRFATKHSHRTRGLP